jgi:hypothetical protein
MPDDVPSSQSNSELTRSMKYLHAADRGNEANHRTDEGLAGLGWKKATTTAPQYVCKCALRICCTTEAHG